MTDSFTWSVVLLIATLLCSKLLPIPLVYHPLSFYAAFCSALARKVHPDPARPAAQQRLAGVLALLLVVGVPLALLGGTYLLASWALLIDAIVLLSCSNWQPYQTQVQRISHSLDKSLSGLARTQARLLLLRDTRQLSRLGIIKALLESLALRFSQQIIAMAFWYLLAGASGVLGYRLCQLASQQWSVKLPSYQHFGRAACRLHQLLCFIPYGISAVFYRLQAASRSKAALLQPQGAPLPTAKQWLLQQLSRTLQVSLGGPAYYQQQQFRRLRLEQHFEPDIADLTRLLRLQQHQFILLLLLLTGIAVVSLFMS